MPEGVFKFGEKVMHTLRQSCILTHPVSDKESTANCNDNVILAETGQQVLDVPAVKGQEGRQGKQNENIRVRVESVANVRLVTRTWWCCMWARCG